MYYTIKTSAERSADITKTVKMIKYILAIKKIYNNELSDQAKKELQKNYKKRPGPKAAIRRLDDILADCLSTLE